MNDLERYLGRATRGLWGRRRQAARAELASHIFERGRQHMAAGMSESEAQQTVLRELGTPALVSRELTRVHTLPLAAPALALALLASGVGVLATRAAAQVRVRVPVPVFEENDSPNPETVHVALNSLKLAFLAAGVQMTGPDEAPTLSAQGLPTITLKLGQLDKNKFDALESGDLWEPLVYPINQTVRYINLASLTSLAAEQGWPVRVAGWDTPVLSIGPASLQLDDVQTATHLYAYEAWGDFFRVLFTVRETAGRPLSSRVATMTVAQSGVQLLTQHHIAARAVPGQVYALAVPYAAPPTLDGHFDTYLIAVAQAAGDGSLAFAVPSTVRHLRYVSGLAETAADFKRFSKGHPTYGSPQVRGNAFVYALDGQIKRFETGGRLNILKVSGTSDGR